MTLFWCLLEALNRFHSFFWCSIVDFEQVNAKWVALRKSLSLKFYVRTSLRASLDTDITKSELPQNFILTADCESEGFVPFCCLS